MGWLICRLFHRGFRSLGVVVIPIGNGRVERIASTECTTCGRRASARAP